MTAQHSDNSDLRLELVATIILACATVLTAWSAFESAKWSGVQAINFSAANAARIESARASDLANTQRAVDVDTFVAWVQAVVAERGAATPSDEPYEPEAGTESGFLFERFRDEFKPAVEAWLATRPLLNPDAPATPFEMQEYQLAADAKAEQLVQESEAHREEALRSNQRSDNYVLLTVIFAAVLLFAGVSTKLTGRRAQQLLLGCASLLLIGAFITLLTFPVEI
ncbi:MAG TPA: hypothetical protein VLB29_08120 [Nocardioidaceae bacterium]|nr:hypothetical protein [Nocardioidaceae bacterium]